MCVDGVNTYQCICFPDLELDAEGRCVSTPLMENQGKLVDSESELVRSYGVN